MKREPDKTKNSNCPIKGSVESINMQPKCRVGLVCKFNQSLKKHRCKPNSLIGLIGQVN